MSPYHSSGAYCPLILPSSTHLKAALIFYHRVILTVLFEQNETGSRFFAKYYRVGAPLVVV